MGITKAQREQRKKRLGSSDMAAILGLDPFRNSFDVWLDKTGKLDEQKETDVMRRGNYLEPAILNFAQDALGKLIRNQFRKADGLPLGSNCDAIVEETGNPVEAKSKGFYANEYWGEPNTDQVPDRVIIQAHVHIMCTGQDFCHVPAYLAVREFQMFGVGLDKDIRDVIAEKAVEFWQQHVLADIPPEDTIPALAVVKRIRREPDLVVDVPEQLVADWLAAKETLGAAKKLKEGKEAALLAILDKAEGGRCDTGLLTYLEQTKQGIDLKQLKAEAPKIAKEYAKISKYRVLRFKKAK